MKVGHQRTPCVYPSVPSPLLPSTFTQGPLGVVIVLAEDLLQGLDDLRHLRHFYACHGVPRCPTVSHGVPRWHGVEPCRTVYEPRTNVSLLAISEVITLVRQIQVRSKSVEINSKFSSSPALALEKEGVPLGVPVVIPHH